MHGSVGLICMSQLVVLMHVQQDCDEQDEFGSFSDFEVTDKYEPNISSPDFSNLPPNQTQPPTEPNISPDFSNIPPPNQTKPSTVLQLQYPPTTQFTDRTNTCMYTSKPCMSKPTPAKKSKPATPLESISPPLSEAISDASSILKNFSSASHQKD